MEKHLQVYFRKVCYIYKIERDVLKFDETVCRCVPAQPNLIL